MSVGAIEVRGLCKSYRRGGRRAAAVDGLDLSVPAGGVHGFLGPNGAGKTTTIRMLLGLIRPDSGSMRIFGETVPAALPEVIDRVGAIVEQPRFFPAFSGRKNLTLLAQAIDVPRLRVDEVLAEVGLLERGRDRFRTYSLGMKQRLAIAATLLKNPDLLIFDEPTNGLDPAGIHEIRATMRGLADRGKTVLVSSHILGEVQLVADTVSIIGRGRLLAEGSVESILSRGGRPSARVLVAEPAQARQLLERAGYTVSTEQGGRLLVGRDDDTFDATLITRTLAEHELYVGELTPVRADLESAFLELTAGTVLGQSPGQSPGQPPGQPPGQSAADQAQPTGPEERPARPRHATEDQ